MELKEKIISSYVAFENKVNINSEIHDIRTEALENFEKVGFPTKKLEACQGVLSWSLTGQ
jgi:Fe-S cluster assembly protein SufD